MYIELKCKKCGKYFHIDFEEKEMTDNKCPNCGHYFRNHHLCHLAETFYVAKEHTEDVEIVGLSSGKKNIVFSSDIDSLNEIYNTSSKDVQIQITRLLDILYLMIRDDAKYDDMASLNKTIAEVRKLYNRMNGNPKDFLVNENFKKDGLLGELES